MHTLNTTQLKALHRFSLGGGMAYSQADSCVISFDGNGKAMACQYTQEHKATTADNFKLLQMDCIAALLYGCGLDEGMQPLASGEAIALKDLKSLCRDDEGTEIELKDLSNALALTQLAYEPVCPIAMTGNLMTVNLCPLTSRIDSDDLMSALFAHKDFGCVEIMPISYSQRLAAPTMVMRSVIRDGEKFQGRLTTCTPLKPLRVREFESATLEYLGLGLGV